MFSAYLLIFIIYSQCVISFAYLNQEEETILTEMKNVLETRQWILVEDFNNQNMKNLNQIKFFVKSKILFAHQSIEQLYKYLLKKSFFKENTLIVFKVLSVSIVSDLFKKLTKVSIK